MSQGTLAKQEDQKLSAWLARPDVAERIGTALGGYLNTEMFISHHLIHIQSKPELAECSVASQYQAIHTCAMLGLMAGYQQVALIPRAKQLTVMPQWQGYKALFERVPEVFEVRAACVHVNDVFEVAGDAPDLVVTKHQYDPFDPRRTIEKLEDIRGTYVLFTFRDERPPRYHFASAAYISKCRACAQTRAIWDKWFEQMALKTAFRSAFSRRVVNVDPMVAGRLEAFTRHEDALLGNDPRIVDGTAEPAPAPHQSRSSYIAGQISSRQTQPAAQVEKRYDLPPGTLTTQQTTQEPLSGELTAGEISGAVSEADSVAVDGSQPQPPGQPKSVLGEFLDLLAETKTPRDVERLRDHYTGPDSQITLTDEQRTEVKAALDSRARELSPSQSVPAKPKKDAQKPLMP